MKSDHKALIAAQEDIKLRTEKGKWIIEVNGGEITETVKSPGNYTGTFDGKWNAHRQPGDHGRVEAGRDHQGAADHARGAGLDGDQGARAVEAQSQLELKGAQVQVSGQRWSPSPAASSTSDRFGSSMTELLGSGLSFPLTVDRAGRHRPRHRRARCRPGDRDHPQHRPRRAAHAARVRLRRARLRVRHHRRGHRRPPRDRSALARSTAGSRASRSRTSTSTSRASSDGQLLINIGYRIRATNHKRNLVYPFYVIPARRKPSDGSPTSSSTTAASRTSSPRRACASTARARSGPSTTSPTPASR